MQRLLGLAAAEEDGAKADKGVPELFAHDTIQQEVDGAVGEGKQVHEVPELDVAVTWGGRG